MMRFLELTNTYQNKTIVNVSQMVQLISQTEGGTAIILSTGDVLLVTESYDFIKSELSKI